jgi:hypothetical protein
MQFTPQETKLIGKLQKEERRWGYLRWFTLAIGLLSIIVCTGWGWILYKLVHESSRDHLDSSDVFVILLLWTKCCMWFVIGTGAFVTACTKWHGDVKRMLLLRLLEDHQKQTVTNAHAA